MELMNFPSAGSIPENKLKLPSRTKGGIGMEIRKYYRLSER